LDFHLHRAVARHLMVKLALLMQLMLQVQHQLD
jgi:hypothetical protein